MDKFIAAFLSDVFFDVGDEDEDEEEDDDDEELDEDEDEDETRDKGDREVDEDLACCMWKDFLKWSSMHCRVSPL